MTDEEKRQRMREYKKKWREDHKDKIKESNTRYKAKKKAGALISGEAEGSSMTEEEYRAAPGVNKSTLWWIRKSPAHYRYYLTNPQQETPALKMGRAIHAAILQPKAFEKGYVASPGFDRRTKEGKAAYDAFMIEAAGREVLSAEEMEQCQAIKKAVTGCESARQLLEGCETEKPFFWHDDESGILCKCRVDAIRPGVLVDLKTCADASTEAFTRDAIKYGYDVQAAHYVHGVKASSGTAPAFYFIAVEKAPPYAVNVIKASDGFLDRGMMQRFDLLARLKECQEADSWPDYGESDLILPAWAEIPEDDY